MRESGELESGVGVPGRESSWNKNPKTPNAALLPFTTPCPQEGPRDLLPSQDGVLEGTAGQEQGTQWPRVKENEERTPAPAQTGKRDCPQELGVDRTDQEDVGHQCGPGKCPVPSAAVAK